MLASASSLIFRALLKRLKAFNSSLFWEALLLAKVSFNFLESIKALTPCFAKSTCNSEALLISFKAPLIDFLASNCPLIPVNPSRITSLMSRFKSRFNLWTWVNSSTAVTYLLISSDSAI